jgi:hypothetical protein
LRVRIGNDIIIDQWGETNAAGNNDPTSNAPISKPQEDRVQRRLEPGRYRLTVEYYDYIGRAMAHFSWRLLAQDQPVGNLITCVGTNNSWVKVYQQTPEGGWRDLNPEGWGAIDVTGYLKIDGLPVATSRYPSGGHPYKVELWSRGRVVRSVGNLDAGQPPFRIYADRDNYTPWQCAEI